MIPKTVEWQIRTDIEREIRKERDRQDEMWGWIGSPGSILPGDNEHAKNTVLGEEVGEVAKALLEGDFDNMETELIQVAAVCVAWLEARIQKRFMDGDNSRFQG